MFPLSSLMATRQVYAGDVVSVDVAGSTGKLIFMRESMVRATARGADSLVGLNEMVAQAEFCPISSAS